ncbi:hypothetical protein N3K66_000012 [Trichothecium roseum]|uniref:Uncharacterized protein n=1 Tax=Trichothecium roseum TaxID=47278 RepID=A0ACC0VCI8_9HYPO|nr:hypothetical protein N3K66_000012 [Trichothecium roseum]
MPAATRITGPIHLDALGMALSALEERHETLRTTFSSRDGVNLQHVLPFQPRQLRVVDLTPSESESLAQALEREQTTAFNLESEPGWRVAVFRLGREEHILSLVMHHIVSDGWSMDILYRELSEFYSSSVAGREPLSGITRLPIQYRDYSVWQKQQDQADEQQRQLEYWLTQLEGNQPAELLCDKPRPSTLSGEAGIHNLRIEGELYENLLLFCKKLEVTPFVVLLAAFRTTHFRLTGSRDATIGTLNANRSRWELNDMIGFFGNMQCIRIKAGDESFESLVRQVEITATAAFANQDVPFERIVSKLQKGRDISRHPLVQIVFALHAQMDLGELDLEGLGTEQMEVTETSRFDLEFHCFQEQSGIRGQILFSTDLYEPVTIKHMVSVFTSVLNQSLRDPQTILESQPLLTANDYQALEARGLLAIEETDYPRESNLPDLFRQQAASHPDKIAVKDTTTQLTYSELDEKSDRLAERLKSRRMNSETLIGVYANRSCETIVAFLGILKANLAYLPLDTKAPLGRIQTILSSVPGQKLVLTGSDVQTSAADYENVEFANIKDMSEGAPNVQSLGSVPSATSLAYIMFTSGSTGKPKGVMIEHRGVIRLVKQGNFVNEMPEGGVMAHMANIAFDVSTWEIYSCLLNGGTLVCIDAMSVLDFRALAAIFSKEHIQAALFTPALFKQYIAECPATISQLRTLILAADRADTQDIFMARRIMKGKIINAYGPTENTVKVKGHRIEIGEIEFALRNHASVTDAVVVLQRPEGQEAQLHGFVTVSDASEETQEPTEDTEEDHVEQWRGLFESDAYATIEDVDVGRIGRDFIGWTSKYDGSEIPKDEMNEWLDDTMSTLLDSKSPGHVLEVGTGSGMILFNLVQGLESYVGLEPSEKAVAFITKTAASIPGLAGKVRMQQGTAADVGKVPSPLSPNLVVINSVAQYFPSREYLLRTVEDLVRLDGVETIFFGDVRSYPMYKEFQISKAVCLLGDSATRNEIQDKMSEIERVEQELLVDPAFFTALTTQLPDFVEHVEVLPKIMKATNELSCYRYAAVIHVKRQKGNARIISAVAPGEWTDFTAHELDRNSLGDILKKPTPGSQIAISNIPYQKTLFERRVVDFLDNDENMEDTASEKSWLVDIRQASRQCASMSAIDLVELAEEVGWRVEISWGRQRTQHGGMDAIFYRQSSNDGSSRVLFQFPTDYESQPPHLLTSQPLKQKMEHSISDQLLERLQTLLPAYMIPQTIKVLDRMPLNDNGKVDRRALAEVKTARETADEDKTQPRTDAERQLQQIWARVLNIPVASVGIDDSFFKLGGDSITAMQVSSASRASLADISTGDIFRKKTIAEIAKSIVPLSDQSSLDILDEEAAGQRFDLSPIQQLYMQLEPDPTRCFDQTFYLKLRIPATFDAIKGAIEELVSRHAMLRARFAQNADAGWEQYISDDVTSAFTLRESDSSGFHDDDALVIRNSRNLLNIETGPLLSAVVFNASGFQSLFLAIHHLVVDLVSWRVLLQDLEELLTNGKVFSAKTIGFQAWSARQAEYAVKELSADATLQVKPMSEYWGIDPKLNVQGETHIKKFTLDKETTSTLLGTCNQVFGTRPVELMLSALIHSFISVFSDREPPTIFSEGHGREPWNEKIDVSRTVGWFTTMWPVQVSSSTDGNLLEVVRQTKDAVRGLSKNGWSYFTSKFADGSIANRNASNFPIEALFNFAGSYQQLERDDSFFTPLVLPEGSDPVSVSKLQRFAIFDFLAQIDHGCLDVMVIYPKGLRNEEGLSTWVEQYEATLKKLTTLLPAKKSEWTLSDFPLAFKSYHDLDAFRDGIMPQLGIGEASAIEDIYPCSAIQEGILIAQEKDSSNYRSMFGLEIVASETDNDIEYSRIRDAWRAVVRRHSLLRAMLVNGIPGTSRTMHIILKDPTPAISYIQGQDATEAYNGVPSYTKRGLQHHLSIYQIGKKRVYLRLEVNHAIIDGYCSGILLHDFNQAYNSSLDISGPLYGDFIRHVEEQSLEGHAAFWKQHLDGVQPCFFPSAERDVQSSGNLEIHVPNLDGEKIHSFCTEWEVTAASVLQVAWALVLQVYTGSSAPCIGTLTSGRDIDIHGVGDMFGPLIGMTPCRVRLDGDRSLLEILREVQADYISSMPHQTYPLMEIHRALQVGPPGLFNTAISVQRGMEGPKQSEDGHTIQFRDGHDQTEYDVTINADHSSKATVIGLSFKAGFISSTQAQRVADAVSLAMRHIVHDPHQIPSQISLVSESDLAQMWSWNGTSASNGTGIGIKRTSTSRFWVVNSSDADQLMPLGLTGELMIEGPVINREYLDESSQASPMVVAAPHWRAALGAYDANTQFCRTGNLAAFTDDGSLQLQGSKSLQVQLRGRRVNTEEVEKQLLILHPDIKELALQFVVGEDGGSKVPRAVGLLTLDTESEVGAKMRGGPYDERESKIMEGLKAYLDDLLPDDAPPPVFISVSSVPKAASGRIDRRRVKNIASALVAQAEEVTRTEEQSAAKTTLALNTLKIQDVEIDQSPQRTHIWLSNQLYPDLDRQRMSIRATRLRGSLQLDALEASIVALELRHDILRTVFSPGSVQTQHVRPNMGKPLRIFNVNVTDENPIETLIEEQTVPFDLQDEPGFRVSIHRVAEDDHILSVVTHDIIGDKLSASIVQEELSVFYGAALLGQEPLSQVEPLPMGYGDPISPNDKQEQLGKQQEQLKYWTAQLENNQAAEFIKDKPRPTRLSGKVDMQEVIIEGTSNHKLHDFCKQREVTPLMVLLAAFRATHYRMTGSRDATIGAIRARRQGTGNMIGHFENLQCLRTQVEQGTFEDLVYSFRTASEASARNQAVPFERIASNLGKPQDMSRHPLAQIMFAHHSQADIGNVSFDALDADPINVPLFSPFDMEFHFTTTQHGLQGQVLFSTDLFNPLTVRSIISVMQIVLKEGLDDPTTAILSMPLLTDKEYASLQELDLIEIDQTMYPNEASLVEIFSQQVMAYPERVAVKDTNLELTYSQLDERSDRLAQWLRTRNMPSEALVGVLASRSCETIVAFLGILKANLAYLPLDTKTPAGRMEAILSSVAGDRLLLLGSDVALPTLDTIDVKFVSIAQVLREQQVANVVDYSPRGAPTATSLAYVMFTSGSTGKPKGVMVDHRAIARLVVESNIASELTGISTVAHMTNVAFDVSTWEIYVAILNGRTLVCVDHMTVLDPKALSTLFSREQVEAANMAPALFKRYTLENPDVVNNLRVLMVGGDRVDERDIYRARQTMRGQLINAYGPTENTGFSTYYCIRPDDEFTSGVPIGTSVSNSGAYVMDDRLRLVPLGVIGELVVTGDGLARGYSDSSLDEGRFVTISIDGRSVKAYRTGDYVRQRPVDGEMEFFGRIDGQIKIKGHRIEIGEIESALNGHDSITDAVVVLHQQKGRDDQIFAFVTTVTDRHGVGSIQDEGLQIQEKLNRRAEAMLPPYMVPQGYMVLDKMPLNANGKIDRQALSQMVPKQDFSQIRREQPMSQSERELQRIWSRVLNLEAHSIGITDSFFRLGGDSITAMQVSSAARASLIDISTGDIFRKKTISELAKLANCTQNQGGFDITSEDDAGDQAFELSPIQNLYMQLESEPNRCFDQTFFLKMRTPTAYDAIAKAIQSIVSAHAMLRARFTRTSTGTWEQRIVSDVVSSFHLTQAYVPTIDSFEALEAIKQCRGMIDIENGPLVSAVVSTAPDAQAIFISIHHLVVDLVSWRILLQDLEEILTSGHASSAPTMAFKSWSTMQSQYSISELHSQPSVSCETQPLLSYWGMEPKTNTHEGTVMKHFSLDEQTTAAILGRSNDAFGTRPVELMISALVHSFTAVFSDRRAPAIFSEGHGREPWDDRLDLSRTVGWFTTLFPTKTRFGADSSLLDVVRQTKDFLRGLSKNGWTWFTSQFSNPESSKANVTMLPIEILFNFAGAYQQLERGDSFFENLSIPEGCDPPSACGLQRLALFDVFAQTERKELKVTFVYPAEVKHQDLIASWITGYRDALKQISVLLGERLPEWTLADFPMAFQSYSDIAEFKNQMLPRLGLSGADEIEEIYPCSPMQEGILLAQAKDTKNYRSIFGIEISGDGISASRIQRAWQAVVKRHSLLRALVTDSLPGSSRAMLIVLRDPIPGVSYYQGKDGAGPYDGPISYQKQGLQHHMSIFHIDDRRAYLRLEINHVIIDGYSSDILLRDFRLAYNEGLDPDGPLYSDFVKHIEDQSKDAARTFWMNRLANTEASFFPASESNQHPETFTLNVSDLNSARITGFCAEWGVTTASIVQAAWALVLRAFTGSATPCFGTLTSGRDVPVRDVNQIFGPLICMMPCRVQLENGHSVIDTLREVQAGYIDSLQHQTFPLMEIQRALAVGPSGLFNSIISFQRNGGELAADEEEGHNIRYQDAQDQTEVCMLPHFGARE